LVFTIPWETAVIIPDFGTFTRLIGVVAGGLGVLAIIEKPRFKVPGPGHILITLFMVWAAATYWWSTDPKQTLVAASSYLQLLVMLWLIWELAPGEREQRRLMQAYVLGTCVSATDTLYQYLSHEEIVERYASTGFNPNDLALALALAIPLSYYLSIQSAGWKVWVYRLQLVLTGTAILLTASRGGFLASLMALAIVPLTYTRLTWLQRVASALTLGVLVCSALFYIPATSWGRLGTISKEVTQGTLDSRTVVWEAGLELFRSHPFVGVGAGAFGESVLPTLNVPFVAHNTFLSILVEEGVIGFGLFCGVIVVLTLAAWEMPPLPQKLWIVSLGAWAVGVSGGSWELRKPTWFLFGLLMGQWASMVQRRTSAHALPSIDRAFCSASRP
jgi:O-antigen ligase